MAVREMEQVGGAHGKCVKSLFLAREVRVRDGQRVEAHGDACGVVFGSSLLGFAWDQKICQSVHGLWQFDQQN